MDGPNQSGDEHARDPTTHEGAAGNIFQEKTIHNGKLGPPPLPLGFDSANYDWPATPYPVAGNSVYNPTGLPLSFNSGNLNNPASRHNGYQPDNINQRRPATTYPVAEDNIYNPIGLNDGSLAISPSQPYGYRFDDANQGWPTTTYPIAENSICAATGLPLSLGGGGLGASPSQFNGYQFGNANQGSPDSLSAAGPVTTTYPVFENVYAPMGLPIPPSEDSSIPLPYSLGNSAGYDATADVCAARYLATYGYQINPPNNSFECDAENGLSHETMGSASMPTQNLSFIDGRAQPSLDLLPTNFQGSYGTGYATTFIDSSTPLPQPPSPKPAPDKYACEYGCQGKGGTFSRRTDRNRHYKSHHLTSATLFCGIHDCNYSSNRSDKLDEHRWRKHADLGYRPKRS